MTSYPAEDSSQPTGVAEFFDAWGSVVYSLAVRILRDRAVAEAVTVKIFASFEPPSSGANLCPRTALLEHARRVALANRSGAESPSQPPSSASLTRKAMELIYFEGLDYRQVATLLDAEPDEIRSAVRSAVAGLKRPSRRDRRQRQPVVQPVERLPVPLRLEPLGIDS